MSTPSIYELGQLRAYITGKLDVLNAQPAPPAPTTRSTMDAGRVNAYADVLAHIIAIEAHQASQPRPADRTNAYEAHEDAYAFTAEMRAFHNGGRS